MTTDPDNRTPPFAGPPRSPLNYPPTAPTPTRVFRRPFPPTPLNVRDFRVNDLWIDVEGQGVYLLLTKTEMGAMWVRLVSTNVSRAGVARFFQAASRTEEGLLGGTSSLVSSNAEGIFFFESDNDTIQIDTGEHADSLRFRVNPALEIQTLNVASDLQTLVIDSNSIRISEGPATNVDLTLVTRGTGQVRVPGSLEAGAISSIGDIQCTTLNTVNATIGGSLQVHGSVTHQVLSLRSLAITGDPGLSFSDNQISVSSADTAAAHDLVLVPYETTNTEGFVRATRFSTKTAANSTDDFIAVAGTTIEAKNDETGSSPTNLTLVSGTDGLQLQTVGKDTNVAITSTDTSATEGTATITAKGRTNTALELHATGTATISTNTDLSVMGDVSATTASISDAVTAATASITSTSTFSGTLTAAGGIVGSSARELEINGGGDHPIMLGSTDRELYLQTEFLHDSGMVNNLGKGHVLVSAIGKNQRRNISLILEADMAGTIQTNKVLDAKKGIRFGLPDVLRVEAGTDPRGILNSFGDHRYFVRCAVFTTGRTPAYSAPWGSSPAGQEARIFRLGPELTISFPETISGTIPAFQSTSTVYFEFYRSPSEINTAPDPSDSILSDLGLHAAEPVSIHLTQRILNTNPLYRAGPIPTELSTGPRNAITLGGLRLFVGGNDDRFYVRLLDITGGTVGPAAIGGSSAQSASLHPADYRGVLDWRQGR